MASKVPGDRLHGGVRQRQVKQNDHVGGNHIPSCKGSVVEQQICLHGQGRARLLPRTCNLRALGHCSIARACAIGGRGWALSNAPRTQIRDHANAVLILTHNHLELGTTHELMMHTRFAKSEEPHIWSEFTQKRTTRMHQFFSASSILEIWLLVLSFILFGMNLTLCCTLHSTYINTSSYQSFTELRIPIMN